MIREIWLTDINNEERFTFNNFGDYTFTSPTSLGVYRSKEFLAVNNQQIEISSLPAFKNITGTIIIKGANKDLEAKYAVLRDFISKHNKKGFRFYVKTQESREARYIKCAIDSLDKTEKATANTMLVPINIIPKTQWLGEVVGVSVVQSVDVEDIFTFKAQEINGNTIYSAKFAEREFTDEYGRTYYSIAFASGDISSTTINNDGEETTPLIIRVQGEAVNPYIALKEAQTGEVLQEVKFNNLTVPNGSYLEINSDPETTYIELVNEQTGERYDVEDFADEETSVYLNLPVGQFVIEASDDIAENVVQTRVLAEQRFGGA